MGPSAVAPLVAGADLPSACGCRYELRFESLFRPGSGFSFPCDARGAVDLDTLTERCRDNYFYARAVVGHELASPLVKAAN